MYYKTTDLAVIISTKDRPVQTKQFLQSLANQNCDLGRVIVVASGQDIKDIVLDFKDSLPVEYYMGESGQIAQRNFGIKLLGKESEFVAFLNDDCIFQNNSLKHMINFIRSVDDETAGISFNRILVDNNEMPLLMDKIFRLKSGEVNSLGIAKPIINLKNNKQVNFLHGGYTIWKRHILEKYHQEPIDSSWAQSEDLRYSYPIGKKYKLFACSKAKITIDKKSYVYNDDQIYKRAKIQVLSHLVFVNQNKELLLFPAILFNIIKLFYNILKIKQWNKVVGEYEALHDFLLYKMKKQDINTLLEIRY